MEIYKKKFILAYLMWLFTVITLIGGVMNFLVYKNNDCKMPVLNINTDHSEHHMTFFNNSEVQYPYLTDRHPLFNYYFSLGDIIMSISILFVIILGVWLIFVKNEGEEHD